MVTSIWTDTIGGLFLIGGFVFCIWSLSIGGRSRGRRRCPKCWYDLRGMPGSLTCSECGFCATREKQFFKTRRYYRRSIFLLIIIILGSGLYGVPRYRIYGSWHGLIPTTVLIVILPWFESTDGFELITPRTEDIVIDNDWSNGLVPNFVNGELWGWQKGMLVRQSKRIAMGDYPNDTRVEAYQRVMYSHTTLSRDEVDIVLKWYEGNDPLMYFRALESIYTWVSPSAEDAPYIVEKVAHLILPGSPVVGRSIILTTLEGWGSLSSGALDALIIELDDAAFRHSAVKALGAIGEGARPALPALRKLRGKSEELNAAVDEAIFKIEGGE